MVGPYRRHELHRSLRVVYHVDDADRRDPRLRRVPDYFSHSYPRMLLEDVGTAMVPHGNSRVGLRPADEAAERAIAQAISLREYTRDSWWAAHQFFSMCAQRVMAYGEDVYAIVYLSEKEGDRPVEFDLMPLPPETILRKRGKLFQHVPQSQLREPGDPARTELPAEQTVVFDLPKHLRGIVSRTLKDLASLGRFGMPEWAMEEFGHARKRVPFDYGVHARAQRLAVANACRSLGWNAKNFDNEGMLEYYALRRELRFERFKTELRGYLLDRLNEALARAGERVGFAGQLAIEGVPSLTDVKTAETHLAAGDTSFGDLMKPFTPY